MDWGELPVDWTVTISGAERYDGEAPFLWAVRARDPREASLRALALHYLEQEDHDLVVVAVAPGVPGNAEVHWNDARDLALLRLSGETARALLSSFGSAERGRDDFEYLAARDQGDYTAEDVSTARAVHELERTAEAEVTQQLRNQVDVTGPESIAGRAGELLRGVLGDSEVLDDIATAFNCGEANDLARALYLLGEKYAATKLLNAHAEDDDEGDQHSLLAGDDLTAAHEFIDAYVTNVESSALAGADGELRAEHGGE